MLPEQDLLLAGEMLPGPRRPTRRCARAHRPGTWSRCRRDAAAASRGRSVVAGSSSTPQLSPLLARHANRRAPCGAPQGPDPVLCTGPQRLIRYRIRVGPFVNTVPYQQSSRWRMTDASGRDMWVEAALKEIGRGGIERVRVEVLAERLGITKGGFYRRFKDRRALLDALLETWTRGRIAATEKQTSSAAKRARAAEIADQALFRAAQSRGHRHRARDPPMGPLRCGRGRSRGQRRRRALEQCRAALPQAGPGDRGCAGAGRSALLLRIGQSLILLEQTAHERANLSAACADVLTEFSSRTDV